MPLFGPKKGKYNLLSNESSFNKSKKNVINTCKNNDYKCKYEQCEREKINNNMNMKGRPLPSLPRQQTKTRKSSSKEKNLYEEPQPLYGNFTTTRKPSSPSEHTYASIYGGTRHRKHVTKSAHKKRGYGKRTMHKRGYGKRTMHKRGKRSTRKRGRKMMRGGVYGECPLGMTWCENRESCMYDDEYELHCKQPISVTNPDNIYAVPQKEWTGKPIDRGIKPTDTDPPPIDRGNKPTDPPPIDRGNKPIDRGNKPYSDFVDENF